MRYEGFHRAIEIFHRETKNTWPLCFCNEIETAALDDLRKAYKDAGLEPPSYTAMVVKAIGLSIAEVSKTFPEINSMLTGFLFWKTIHTFDTISAGVAISRDEEGKDRAVQSVIQQPDKMPLSEMTARLQEYATKAVKDVDYMRNCHYLYRIPRVAQEVMLWVGRTFPKARRLYRGTFSLTSVGKFGVDIQVTLPQASCLQFGFGVVRERPVVREGKVVPARTFFLTLSFDRRLMNGKPCALMMERIRDILHKADFGEALPVPAKTSKPPTDNAGPANPLPISSGQRHVA